MEGNVYTGFWTNWEHGILKGATLKLPTYQGLVLVFFLTLFVQFSGACFWRVICFVFHQLRSTTAARDGLFHQQQSILRNATTAPNALWSLSRSSLAWRTKVKSPIRNSLPLMTITVVHLSFFAAAGLFSSRVTSTAAGQALVKVGVCGKPKELANIRNTESVDLTEEDLLTFNTEVVSGRLTLAKSAAYVRSCYNDDMNGTSAACNLFVRPHLVGIDSSSINNASCPFGSDACATAAVRYDSGLLHSNKDLGINYPDRDSLSMRRVTTCAPILGEKYATAWRIGAPETLAGLSNTSTRYYEFGKSDKGCDATNSTTSSTTFCVTKYQKVNLQNAYTVRAKSAYYNNEIASDFVPIPDFNVPHADVTIVSILSQAKYAGSTTDPLFKALNLPSQNSQFYTASNDLGIPGYIEQYQFCNIKNERCTNLTGLYGIKEVIEKGDLSLTSRQQAVYDIIWKAAWSMSLQWAFEVLSDDLLRARDWVFTVKSTTSSSLPANQWELEAFNLHNLSLAVLQRRINEYASPENFEIRPGLNSLDQIIRPTEPNMLELCSSQKIRSSDHYSISVLGMGIIFGVGSLLILLDWILIQQTFRFRSLISGRHTKKSDWKNTGTLQLQRQALEVKGVGPWSMKDYEFPVLVERSRTFWGLGAQMPTAIPLEQMGDGRWEYEEQGGSYMGGGYAVVPHLRSSSDVEIHIGDDKVREGDRR